MKATLDSMVAMLQKKISSSFDLVYRHVKISDQRCVLVFLSSLSDSALIADIVGKHRHHGKKRSHVNLLPGQCRGTEGHS